MPQENVADSDHDPDHDHTVKSAICARNANQQARQLGQMERRDPKLRCSSCNVVLQRCNVSRWNVFSAREHVVDTGDISA
jgi:hypothetical protein